MFCAEYRQVTVTELFFFFFCGLYFASKELSIQLALKAQALPGIPPEDVKPNYSRNWGRTGVDCENAKKS